MGRRAAWSAAESIADGRELPPDLDSRLAEQLGIIARVADVHRDPAQALAGQRWGQLHLVERLAEGAFAEVFRAWDTRLEREVALKLLYPSQAHPTVDRAFAEARMLARVRHPNVVTVFGADVSQGRVGVWMELLAGRTLQSQQRAGMVVGARQAAEVGSQLCDALAAVHAAGVVHGDVKPSNVMIASDGRLVLTDFGAGADRLSPPRPSTYGTPRWMAPELLEGSVLTPAADIYGAGAVLYWLLTGDPPMLASGGSAASVSLADRRPDLPPVFAGVIQRAVSPDPLVRQGTAQALGDALVAALKFRRSRSRLTLAVLAATLTLLMGGGGWMAREALSATLPAAADHASQAAYLKARYEWNKRTPEGFLAARDRFEEAVALDPGYASAYAGLADTYLLLAEFGVAPDSEALPRAEAAARRALSLNPRLAPAWTSLAYLHVIAGRLVEGKEHYRRAISLDPNYPTARHWYALTIVDEQPDEAIVQISRALELDPFSRAISTDLAMVYWRAGQLRLAAEQFARNAQLFPEFVEAHIQLGRVLLAAGRFEEAAAGLEEAHRRFGDHQVLVKELAVAYALSGQETAARAALSTLVGMAERMRIAPWLIGQIHAALGDVEAAIAWLTRSREQGDRHRPRDLSDPSFSPVRNDPRMIGLMMTEISSGPASKK